jgi:hypothetical protein
MNQRPHLNNMMSITRIVLAIILIHCSFSGIAQNELEETLDSAFISFPDSFVITDPFTTVKIDTLVSYDSTELEVRKVDQEKISNLKEDPDLDYTITPTVESVWSRILWWLASLFLSLLGGASEGGWFKYLIWGIGIAILIYVILRLLKIDALKVFYSGQGKSITYTSIDENIHEMDFDKLISNAAAAKDYRLAIRLQFLQALKILSDKHLIHWQPGKTNHDYMLELGKNNLRPGFTELNEYFEYAWYGNFPIAPELFNKVKVIFDTWRRQA